MTTRLVSCILFASVLACGDRPPGDEWNGAVVRAVARTAAATQPASRLVVLGTVAGPDGTALPWAVRQSLTTGGIELGDTSVMQDPAAVLLVFDRSIRAGPEWLVHGRLLHAAAGESPDSATMVWRVRCVEDECDAIGRKSPPGEVERT